MKHANFPEIGERTVDELLFWWPNITAKAKGEWERGFTKSILLCSRRRGWQPTAKQLGIMRRMVADWFSGPPRAADELPLIE